MSVQTDGFESALDRDTNAPAILGCFDEYAGAGSSNDLNQLRLHAGNGERFMQSLPGSISGRMMGFWSKRRTCSWSPLAAGVVMPAANSSAIANGAVLQKVFIPYWPDIMP